MNSRDIYWGHYLKIKVGKQSLLHPNVGTAKSKCHLMKTPFSVSSGRLIPDTAVAQRPVMGSKVRGLPLTQKMLASVVQFTE